MIIEQIIYYTIGFAVSIPIAIKFAIELYIAGEDRVFLLVLLSGFIGLVAGALWPATLAILLLGGIGTFVVHYLYKDTD